MSSVTFTITDMIAATPNVSIQVAGDPILEKLEVITFDKSATAVTTSGQIKKDDTTATIVTKADEFTALFNAVSAMAGNPVPLTMFFTKKGTSRVVNRIVPG